MTTTTLNVRHTRSYEYRPVAYQRPVELHSFSYDADRNLHLDDRELKFYHPPQLGTPLGHGYPHNYQERAEENERLDAMLHCLRGDVREGFVMWRGILTKLLATPYFRREKWMFCATRFRGVIYVHEPPQESEDSGKAAAAAVEKSLTLRFERRGDAEGDVFGSSEMVTSPIDAAPISHVNPSPSIQHTDPASTAKDSSEQNHSNMEEKPSWHQMTYWGYRFETLSTLPDHPRRIPDLLQAEQSRLGAPVNTNCQYATVVKTRLGRHALVLGAEVDCTSDDKYPNDACRYYMELKTNRQLHTAADHRRFEKFKLLKCYLQSFLVSVPRIVVGFRDDWGVLREVRTYETLKVPRMVREKGYWDPNVCLNFGNEVLQWLQQEVKEEGRRIVYRFWFDPDQCCVCIEREQDESESNEHIVIPEWYADVS